jgi:hypothetical protein
MAHHLHGEGGWKKKEKRLVRLRQMKELLALLWGPLGLRLIGILLAIGTRGWGSLSASIFFFWGKALIE